MFQRSNHFLEGRTKIVSIGIFIKVARKKKGWTQTRLATETGVTPSFITKLEKNESRPGYELAQVLVQKLEVSFEELWAKVEEARLEAFQQKTRTRSETLRRALPRQQK